MIKCKLANVEGNCPKQKDICCHKCEDFETCTSVCGEEDPTKCDEAIFEGSNELEVFQNKTEIVIKKIADITNQKKSLEEQEKTMREQLEKVMNECNVKSFENELVKITYMPESIRNSIDSAKLKKNYPDIAAECNKSSKVKSFVKIEVK